MTYDQLHEHLQANGVISLREKLKSIGIDRTRATLYNWQKGGIPHLCQFLIEDKLNGALRAEREAV